MTSPPVLVLDAMGVIYDHGDDVNELLVPYVRSLGCTMSQSQINAYYIQCSLGRITSKQLWEELGVAKPIYEQLVASVGVSGESIILVDDRVKNFRGPHVAGWQCIAYGHTPSEVFRDIPRVASMVELETILKEFSL